MIMALRSAGLDKIRKGVVGGREFNAGNVRAAVYQLGQLVPIGRLCEKLPEDHPYRWDLINMVEPVYVVFSYATPIGWRPVDSELWRVPPVSYSRTTTNHQSALNAAIRARKAAHDADGG